MFKAKLKTGLVTSGVLACLAGSALLLAPTAAATSGGVAPTACQSDLANALNDTSDAAYAAQLGAAGVENQTEAYLELNQTTVSLLTNGSCNSVASASDKAAMTESVHLLAAGDVAVQANDFVTAENDAQQAHDGLNPVWTHLGLH
jgi:hypothetical protein